MAGKGSAIAVQLHSAPSLGTPAAVAAGVTSSVHALSRSLQEVLTWDWRGAAVAIEHCDAAHSDGSPPAAKGFLSLDEELAALQLVERDAEAVPSGGTTVSAVPLPARRNVHSIVFGAPLALATLIPVVFFAWP